jgi:hypothetical protein
MPLLRNTVSGAVRDLPDSYVGLYPFELVEPKKAEEPAEKEQKKVLETPKKRTSKKSK